MEPTIKVKIDHEKLLGELKEQKKTTKELSAELGMAECYIATRHKRGDEYPASMEKLMCFLLGKEPGYFILPEEKDVDTGTENPKILENIFRECKWQHEALERIEEKLDTLFRKVNANTVQLEKLKESMGLMAKTDLDVAVDFLKNILSGGRVEGMSVLMEADSAGIKHSNLMKAKKELEIQIETSGYGKNQKNWWYLKN